MSLALKSRVTALDLISVRYQREPDGSWLRLTYKRSSCGCEGIGLRRVTLNTDMLIDNGGMIAKLPVDWFYRAILWMYHCLGVRRFFIWYKNLED